MHRKIRRNVRSDSFPCPRLSHMLVASVWSARHGSGLRSPSISLVPTHRALPCFLVLPRAGVAECTERFHWPGSLAWMTIAVLCAHAITVKPCACAVVTQIELCHHCWMVPHPDRVRAIPPAKNARSCIHKQQHTHSNPLCDKIDNSSSTTHKQYSWEDSYA